MLHVINGGSEALHPADEALYTDDGGDCGCQAIGPECLRRNPQLKEFAR